MSGLASELAREAHDYAAAGWAVFPLQPGLKKPYGFTTGLKAASADVALVGAWWAGRMSLPLRERRDTDTWFPEAVRPKPGSNIGMATGRASGVWVLDVDGEAGIASLLALAEANGRLPATVRQHTGGGGGQLFYRWPGVLPWGTEIRNGASAFAEHLDVRGAGGYVVLPPSIHPSGRAYAWADGCAPWEITPAAAPWWLLRTVAPPPAPVPTRAAMADRPVGSGRGYGQGALDAARAEIAGAPPGQQNATLHRNAYGVGRLVAGGELGQGEARQALISAGLRMAIGDARRPWTERDVAAAVDNAFKRSAGDPKRAPEGGR